MYLMHLTLTDYRNYTHLDISLVPGLCLFYGENAQGKTNLLEAISMLATGTSFHASNDREVVNWSARDHISRLGASVKRTEDEVQVEVVVFDPTPPLMQQNVPTQKTVELPATMQRKRFKVNGIPKRAIDL